MSRRPNRYQQAGTYKRYARPEPQAYARAEQAIVVTHGYRSAGELLSEIRIASIYRPTENDAILSMIFDKLMTVFSLPSTSDMGGRSREGYSAPPRTERAIMLDMGYKWCNGYSGKVHEAGYMGVYDFYANAARSDGLDSMCAACRRHSNRMFDQSAA